MNDVSGIDTVEELNCRFGSGGFSAAGGNTQSLTSMIWCFMSLFQNQSFVNAYNKHVSFVHEPSEEKVYANFALKLHDYGCAEGDGTAAIKAFFPNAQVTGFDISEAAIERARSRWPIVGFKVGDIRSPEEDADVIFTLHTLEHFHNPADIINGLLNRCRTLVAVVPPLDESCMGGHEGAIEFSEWRKEISPIAEASYNVLRQVPETGDFLVEGNILMLFNGGLEA